MIQTICLPARMPMSKGLIFITNSNFHLISVIEIDIIVFLMLNIILNLNKQG